MKILTFFLGLAGLIQCAIEVPRIDPSPTKYVAAPDYMNVAESQLFKIPLSEAISQRVVFIPHHKGDCIISSASGKYKQMASHPLQKTDDAIITSFALLKNKGYAYTIDQKFMLTAYGFNNTIFKELGQPKKVVIHSDQISNPILVAQPNQEGVYILSSLGFAYFNSNLYGTNVKTIKTPTGYMIRDGIIADGYLYAACEDQGLHVYKINEDKQLSIIRRTTGHHCIDVQYDSEHNILYTLDKTFGVLVYRLNNGIPILLDSINTTKYTAVNIQMKVRGPRMLIFFFKNNRYYVAEFNYQRSINRFTFIRYFKFTYQLKEIHLLKNHFIGVGLGYIGVFPIGIHPKLIKSQQNGWLTLSSINSLHIINEEEIVGITSQDLVYGNIEIKRTEQIQCLQAEIQSFDTIIYQANVTKCSIAGAQEDDALRQYYQYCQYEKTFYIDKMKIVVHNNIATLLKILFLVIFSLFLLALLCTILLRLFMKHRIRRLQTKLQQTRKMLPLGSHKNLQMRNLQY